MDLNFKDKRCNDEEGNTHKWKKKNSHSKGKFKAGKGRVRINKRPVELYDPELARLKIQEPLTIAA